MCCCAERSVDTYRLRTNISLYLWTSIWSVVVLNKPSNNFAYQIIIVIFINLINSQVVVIEVMLSCYGVSLLNERGDGYEEKSSALIDIFCNVLIKWLSTTTGRTLDFFIIIQCSYEIGLIITQLQTAILPNGSHMLRQHSCRIKCKLSWRSHHYNWDEIKIVNETGARRIIIIPWAYLPPWERGPSWGYAPPYFSFC